MKKFILLAGCALLLSLSTIFTGCKEDKPENPANTVNNVLTIGDEKSDIIAAEYTVIVDGDWNCAAIKFTTNGRTLLIGMPNNTSIPTGTFSITDTTNFAYTEDDEYYIAGTMKISKFDDIYAFEVNGLAIKDLMIREELNFSCTYQGEIPYHEMPVNNVMKLDDETIDITDAYYRVDNHDNTSIVCLTFIGEDGQILDLFLTNQTEIPNVVIDLYEPSLGNYINYNYNDMESNSIWGYAAVGNFNGKYYIEIEAGLSDIEMSPFKLTYKGLIPLKESK